MNHDEQTRQAGNEALTQLVDLARDLGIPASRPRTESETRGLVEAIRERIHTKAHGLAHQCRDIGAGVVR